MQQEFDYKKRADCAIECLEKLLKFHKDALEHWENGEYCDTDVGKEMIEVFQDSIKEVEDEIKAYEQYKATGVFISRQVRDILKNAEKKKENDDSERTI